MSTVFDRTILVGVSSILFGCAWQAEALRPTDASTRARGGEPAAAYDVRDDSRLLAHVIVWSQGAYVDGGGTYVHVAAEVQNVGAQPLSLDAPALEVQAFDEQGAPLPSPRLVAIQPPGAESRPVAAASAQDFDFFFLMPPGVPPAAIGSLRVRWSLVQDDGRKYVQFTDFTNDVPRVEGYVRAYVPVYGFYDPFFVHPRIVVIHHVPPRRVVVPSRPRRHH